MINPHFSHCEDPSYCGLATVSKEEIYYVDANDCCGSCQVWLEDWEMSQESAYYAANPEEEEPWDGE